MLNKRDNEFGTPSSVLEGKRARAGLVIHEEKPFGRAETQVGKGRDDVTLGDGGTHFFLALSMVM